MIPRIIICPHGLPCRLEAREHCSRLVLRCGGDLERVIEGVSGALERFLTHVSRIRAVAADGPRPLVLLTRTNPLGLAILQTRRAMEDAVPALADADWTIFVDECDDPFFMEAAGRLGTMVGDAASAPLWFAPHHQRFLVLGARALDSTELAARCAALHSPPPFVEPSPEAESCTRLVAPRVGPDSVPPDDFALRDVASR